MEKSSEKRDILWTPAAIVEQEVSRLSFTVVSHPFHCSLIRYIRLALKQRREQGKGQR